MDTSTLLVVFLLVTAASLASYALSHWTSLRGGLGWAATGVGTTMLLAAAAIVVLILVFRAPLWRPNLASEQQLRKTGSASTNLSAHQIATSTAPGDSTSTSAGTLKQTAPAVGNRQEAGGPSATSLGDNERRQKPTSAQPAEQSKSARYSAPLPVFADNDPWAATQCVAVFNPDPGEPTRWKIENDCDVPVGVVLSYCSEGQQACAQRNATVWKYPGRPMGFPAKLQRPIPLEEQTVYGDSVRYVACFFGTPAATYLIGAPNEERSTSAWREQFEAARARDGCLMQVQSWSDEGRRTRLPIDVLLGVSTQPTERNRSIAR